MKKTHLRTPAILPDETLSSWLIRIALHYGCDVPTLARHIWGSGWKRARDMDRYLTSECLERLTEHTGVPVATLDEMQLIYLSRLHTTTVLHENIVNWRWLTPSGVGNIKKGVRVGFCPQCFAEKTPYLRRHWRMSWATACTHHGIRMHHNCPECGMYFIPSRLTGLEKSISVCRHCGYDLRNTEGITADTDFQKTAEHILNGNEAVFDGKKVSSAEWFETARYFVSLIREATAAPTGMVAKFIGDFGIQPVPIKCGGIFEHLFPEERHGLLSGCAVLMRQSIGDLIQVSSRYEFSSNTLDSVTRCSPTVLLRLWHDHLESRNGVAYDRERTVSPATDHAVRRKWALLQRKLEREVLS